MPEFYGIVNNHDKSLARPVQLDYNKDGDEDSYRAACYANSEDSQVD